jgi:two-component system chemotaxis response regulator CheY
MKYGLVVDDSRVIRKVARKILEELHVEAEEAEDGLAALEVCRRKMPDIILLDGHMPNMNGVEFLKVLRRETNGSFPKIVFCFTEADVGHIAEALAAGANDYVVKPFDRASLQAKLLEVGLVG